MARSTRVQPLLLQLRWGPRHSMPARREPPMKRRALARRPQWPLAAQLKAS